MPVTRGGLPPGRTVLPTGWSAPPAAARQASGQPVTAVGKKKNHDSPVTGCGFPFPTSPLSGASRQILRHVRDGRWECASEDAHLLPSVGQGRPGGQVADSGQQAVAEEKLLSEKDLCFRVGEKAA